MIDITALRALEGIKIAGEINSRIITIYEGRVPTRGELLAEAAGQIPALLTELERARAESKRLRDGLNAQRKWLRGMLEFHAELVRQDPRLRDAVKEDSELFRERIDEIDAALWPAPENGPSLAAKEPG